MLDIEPASKNSMLYWYPKIKDIVPTPETKFVKLYKNEKDKDFPFRLTRDTDEVKKVIDDYPVFIRTDIASNKHQMEISSKVNKEDELDEHISRVLEFNEIATILGLPYRCLVIREWLELDYNFKAFNETPIASELRFFINNGEIMCSHFYWADKAIKFYDNEVDNWRLKWKKTRDKTMKRKKSAIPYIEQITGKMDGYWSIDVAFTREGEPYIIDMALGEESWHPDCKYKPEENRKKHNKEINFEDLFEEE